jgi:soluble lytic murein transglycosylase-like protein
MAGRDYRIDPDLLRAISWQESWVVDAIGKNPGTGYGAGLMQIDSQHHARLSEFGIKPEHLLTDACLNIYTGAYYLALAFKKWGVSWEAVGAYNAGFRRTDRQACDDWHMRERLRLSTGPSRQIKMPDNPGLLKTKDLMNEVFFSDV